MRIVGSMVDRLLRSTRSGDDATAPPRMSPDALKLLYDLAPAQFRVSEMLSTGMTQAAVAALGNARG